MVNGTIFAEFFGGLALGHEDFISRLKVHPELGTDSEKAAEPDRGVAGYAEFFTHDPFDARARDATSLRDLAGRKAERLQELLTQHLAGMHGRKRRGDFEFFG